MNYISRFASVATEMGSKTALVDEEGKRTMSYRDVDEMRLRFVSKLKAQGLPEGSAVIVKMSRGSEYVISVLGILSAGYCVIPITHDYPQDRIDFIKEDCNASLVIDDDFTRDLPIWEKSETVSVDDDQAVYMLYTSGSTGRPKGVVHTLKSFNRIANDEGELWNIGSDNRAAAISSTAFVAFVYEILVPLGYGQEVHILSDGMRRDNERIAGYFRKHKINISIMSPQLLRTFKSKSPCLKRIITGSEMVSGIYSDGYEILNSYGSSEMGLISRFSIDKAYRNTPIGKPFRGVEFKIADNGELEVILSSVGRYLNRTEDNAKTFEELENGRVLYHTGDQVEQMEDGNYLYLNRIDWMTKINGQRVEIFEVENVLKEAPQVKNAVVKAFQDSNGQNYLCGYYVKNRNSGAEGIREFLEERLPHYMIPRFLVEMEVLPLNVNGKIDRKGLNPPSIEDYKNIYEAPIDEKERIICEAFSEILECGRVGRNDDFFALGGDSIKVLKVTEAICKGTGLSLVSGTIFTAKTPAFIAQELVDECFETSDKEAESGERASYPLTEAMKGVYLECIERPESTMYNIPFALHLPDGVNIEKLCRCIRKVWKLHPALSIRTGMHDGEPVMIRETRDCDITLSHAESEEEIYNKFVKPFNLQDGPLYRLEICDISGEKVLLMDIHHLVSDGTTMRLILNQIADSYSEKELKEEKFTIFDLSRNEIILKGSKKYRKAQDFFKEKFEGTEYEEGLTADQTENQTGAGLLIKNAPEKLGREAAEHFVRKTGITENTLFLSAFAYTIAKMGGSNECYFTTVNNGRHEERLADTAGMLVKTLPLHFTIEENEEVKEFLTGVQESFYQTMEHDCISFGELVNEYGVRPDISFVYQAELLSEIELAGERIKPIELPVNDCQQDIICMVLKTDQGYRTSIHYRKNLYTEAFIESLADTLFSVAASMLHTDKLSHIRLISDGALEFIRKFNDTAAPGKRDSTVNNLLDEAIRRYPDKTMLIYKDRCYNYTQFDRITRNIAGYISEKGIDREEFVAILVPRDEYMVLASWGVIRSGAAFQPLDATYPSERLNYMISDSKARLLIADRNLRHLVDEYNGDVLYTDEIPGLPDIYGNDPEVSPESAITTIYTSGTTGKPKGCILENRNFSSFCDNHIRYMDFNADSQVAQYASFGFDAAAMDIISVPLTGATLHIIPEDIRLDFIQLEQFFCQNGITHAFMTTQVGRMFAEQTKCQTLRVFLVGGEKLVPFTPPKNMRFINAYGPCETTAYICHHVVSDNHPIQPIGRPNFNTQLYIADKQSRLLPVGAIGELCISGWQVGRGYLGLPEKTAEVFVENPFTNEAGHERMYRTGDLARLLPNGEIDFIGRKDSQVKIRGFRIELTEVEEVIRRFHGITDATVVALDEPSGGKYLAAYITSPEKIDTDELNAFILEEKPPYMVPAITMQIDEIPYNQNQKVNKRALPAPRRSDNGAKRKPENAVQQQIYDIVKDILRHEEFGIDTNLFYAGITSISALKLNVKLSEFFQLPFKISDIKEHNTIKTLAQHINTLNAKPSSDFHETRLEDYPLMQNQMGVFIECSMKSSTTKYNIPMLLKLSPRLNLERLVTAIRQAVNAHPFIKTILKNKDGEVRAQRRDDAEVHIETITCDTLPTNGELIKPFTLMGEELYRIIIYKTATDAYLFMDFHHIIADGTSMAILLQDIGKAYSGEPVKKESFTGYEALNEEVQLMHGDSYKQAKVYYDTLFAGYTGECLPAKCPDDGALQGESKLFSMTFDSCSSAINSYLAEHKVTANAFFNAVFSYTLARYIHSESVSYCTVYNGRNDSRYASCFSMLVKTLPVCCDISIKENVCDFVNEVGRQLLDTMAHDSMPFSEISNNYKLKPDIFFNYQGDSFVFDKIGGEPAEMIPLELSESKAPLAVEIFLNNGTYRAEVNYRSDYFCKEFISSFIHALATAAEAFTSEEKLCRVSILSEEEKNALSVMNATETPFAPVPAQKFFEEWAKNEPSKLAVKTATDSISYGELNRKADHVAQALLNFGIDGNEVVAIILERSIFVPIAEIGILKTGAAFLPMLPTYPDDRLEYCLLNADCRYVIASQDVIHSHASLLAEGKPYRTLSIEEILATEFASMPMPDSSQNDLAYCIYTSGSTGTPKGVMIEQHNLSNFVQTSGLKETLAYGNTILCMASISFDMSISEIFFSLCHGKTLYIATEDEIHNLDRLIEACTDNHVDIAMMTPSFAWTLLSLPAFEEVFRHIGGITLGAEAFKPALFSKLKSLNPAMFIQNGYGPTECTMACSAKTVTASSHITIGGPFANTQFQVMDTHGNLLPRYAVGELIICGECVSRGYVKLPEKTAASFITVSGKPAYRSGDIVRINRDGEAEFSGRADGQVKLRGFRVEIGEIENVMLSFSGITQCKVLVKSSANGDFLAGYFTASHDIDIQELIAFMKKKLTYYMVPAAMIKLDKMPVTPNGKLDVKALPEPDGLAKHKGKGRKGKDLAGQVLEVFSSVLNQQDLSVDDNFFDLGGTSLSASNAVMQLKSRGFRIEYQDIFDHQTAEALACHLEMQQPSPTSVPALDASHDAAVSAEEKEIKDLLQHNTMEYAALTERTALGNVVLTGATGFLGCHVLHELLQSEEGHIWCLMRKGKYADVTERLKAMLFYYFEDHFTEAYASRITVMEGDITDDRLTDMFRDIRFDTIINCAASVKHFASDGSIRFVNVHGVENLIALSIEKGARLVQISTTSVPGMHTDETFRLNLRMTEDRLFVVDDIGNQYTQSKYEAEMLILRGMRRGLRGKIIRVGNLMGRFTDGQFQIGAATNAFMGGIRGYVALGVSPMSHATDQMSFSPIDYTARAVCLLAGTNDIFTAFNADSRYAFDQMKIIEALGRVGLTVKPVSDEQYQERLKQVTQDPVLSSKISTLVRYDRPGMHPVSTDNRFTASVLYRLGFAWPCMDEAYLERLIEGLDTLGYFLI